jgi:hypothetical protein
MKHASNFYFNFMMIINIWCTLSDRTQLPMIQSSPMGSYADAYLGVVYFSSHLTSQCYVISAVTSSGSAVVPDAKFRDQGPVILTDFNMCDLLIFNKGF